MKERTSKIYYLPRPKKDIFIYALLCPFTREVRYVGLTTIGFRRLVSHWKSSAKNKPTRVKNWIAELKKDKLVFEVKYLEYFDEDSSKLDEAEVKWIKYYKDLGINLLNDDKGGRNTYLTTHRERIDKRTEENKLLFNSPEYKEYYSKLAKEQWTNPEKRKKLLEGRKDYQESPKPEKALKNMKAAQTKLSGVKIQDDLGRIFNSMTEAANFYNVGKSTIQRALYGKTSLLGERKLTRLGGGRKSIKDLRPLNSYYKHKTSRRWKKTLAKQNSENS